MFIEKNTYRFLICAFLFFNAADTFGQSIGNSVSILGVDGKTYTGVVMNIANNMYQIKYDGYDALRWLSSGQIKVINKNTTTVSEVQANSSTQDLENLNNIYQFGDGRGWSSQLYKVKYNNFLKNYSAKDLHTLLLFLQQATTSSARFFALKSLITGDSYAMVQTFISQLNNYPENYQQQNCVVTNARSIIQQWEYSCSVTVLQTYLADLSPRYAWEVKQIPNFDAIADNASFPMAEQQKELLEKYGGIASKRGDLSGRSIGINDPLNQLVAPILGVSFYAQEVNEPLPVVLGKIRNQLDRGIDVPLLIGFVGTQSRHFIMAMRYTSTASGYSYLIYDPWDGKCEYVKEASLMSGSLAPLLTQWAISLDYYYPVK